MADTNGTGRYHFQVKTDVSKTGIKEILHKMYNEEFREVSFTGSKKKKIHFAPGYEVYGNRGWGNKTKKWALSDSIAI